MYEVKLLEIANVQVGYQSRGRIEENLDGKFTIIRSQDYDKAGNICIDNLMSFTPTSSIDTEKYLVTVDDILVQARGQSHLAYLLKTPIENAVASNTFYIIRLKEQGKVLPAYLAWCINQPKVQAYFKREQGVSTILFISKAVLLNANIRIPPIETQAKISKLMQLWQRDQELARQLTEKKNILIQAVARKATLRSAEVNQ